MGEKEEEEKTKKTPLRTTKAKEGGKEILELSLVISRYTYSNECVKCGFTEFANCLFTPPPPPPTTTTNTPLLRGAVRAARRRLSNLRPGGHPLSGDHLSLTTLPTVSRSSVDPRVKKTRRSQVQICFWLAWSSS